MLAQVEEAIEPWLPYLLLFVLFVVVYYELRGTWSRVGTTARRSSAGSVLVLGLLGVLGIGLVLTGWATLGALTLLFVAAAAIIWAATSASRER